MACEAHHVDEMQGTRTMSYGFEDFQRFQRDQLDTVVKSVGAYNKGLQAIAVEIADYSKKSYEESAATAEKLFGARTMDKALEIQTAFARSSYEGLVAEMTKLGELYVDLAKEAVKPYEGALGKAAAPKA